MLDVICGLDQQRKSMHAVFAVAMDHHVPSQFINGTWKQCHFVRLPVAVVSFLKMSPFFCFVAHFPRLRNQKHSKISVVNLWTNIYLFKALKLPSKMSMNMLQPDKLLTMEYIFINTNEFKVKSDIGLLSSKEFECPRTFLQSPGRKAITLEHIILLGFSR